MSDPENDAAKMAADSSRVTNSTTTGAAPSKVKSTTTQDVLPPFPAGTAFDPPAPPDVKSPDIESLHRDLAVANSYRQEFIKSLLLIAGGLFAFSVGFRPELRNVAHEELFWIAWIGLGVSMVGGFGQLAAWERFYASYQRFDWKRRPGKPYRETIDCLRKAALFFQVLGFIAGVCALGSFTAINLGNVEHTKHMAAETSVTSQNTDYVAA